MRCDVELVKVKSNVLYNSPLWLNAKPGDGKVMSKPLYEQLLADSKGNAFEVVKEEIAEKEPEDLGLSDFPVPVAKKRSRKKEGE